MSSVTVMGLSLGLAFNFGEKRRPKIVRRGLSGTFPHEVDFPEVKVLLLHLDYLWESRVTLGSMGGYPERFLLFASAKSMTVHCEKSFFGCFYTPGFSP